MEFGQWVTTQAGSNGQNNADQRQQSPSVCQAATTGNKSGEPPGSSEQVFSHQVEHPGVVCDNCGSAIFGFRYKCLNCVDYDLCSNCERRGLHAGHIMMRIPFPEMTRDAIRRHAVNSFPDAFPFGQYDHERNPHPQYGGREHRPDHCRARRRRPSHSSPESGDEETRPGWCPYQMGKKEWKKLAKTMKKTAETHRRAAECQMKRMRSRRGEPIGEGTVNPENTPHQEVVSTPFDFTAAATQIQEFLNAFGLPIDVVELFDGSGNRGVPANQQNAPVANLGSEESGVEVDGAETSQAQAQDVAEKLENLHIADNETIVAPAETNLIQLSTASTSVESSVTDAEADEWTIVENGENSPRIIKPTDLASTSAVEPSATEPATPIVEDTDETGERETKIFRPAPVTENSTPIQMEIPTPQPPQQQQPLYPQLGPIVTPIVTGLTNTLGNMTRAIPIIPWVPAPPRPAPPQIEPQLNEQMSYTLNQLLSMGFSNHNGDLARLVYAKNGNLEDILNSLFPTGSN